MKQLIVILAITISLMLCFSAEADEHSNLERNLNVRDGDADAYVTYVSYQSPAYAHLAMVFLEEGDIEPLGYDRYVYALTDYPVGESTYARLERLFSSFCGLVVSSGQYQIFGGESHHSISRPRSVLLVIPINRKLDQPTARGIISVYARSRAAHLMERLGLDLGGIHLIAFDGPVMAPSSNVDVAKVEKTNEINLSKGNYRSVPKYVKRFYYEKLLDRNVPGEPIPVARELKDIIEYFADFFRERIPQGTIDPLPFDQCEWLPIRN